MTEKNIKIPLIAGVILYGIALIIHLGAVFLQKSVFRIMGSDYLAANMDTFIFPLFSVFQIIVMIMYIIFMIVMLKYKGAYRKLAGILMIVVYCIVNIVSPFINVLDRFLTSKLKDSEELSALSAIESFMIFVSPFTVVASVLILIAIGRYGISKEEHKNLTETQEGYYNDKSIH